MKKFPVIARIISNLLITTTLLLLLPLSIVTAEPVTAVPFYRFYRPFPLVPQVHLYSTDTDVGEGWVYEGINAYVSPQALEYTVPLYRFFNTLQWDHLYTVREPERSRLLPSPYIIDEGIAGYVLPWDKDLPGTATLYRFSRTFRVDETYYRDHFYSMNDTPPSSYVSEGICCRIWKDSVALPDRLFTLSAPDSSDTWVQGSVQRIAWTVWGGGGIIRIHYSDDDETSWTFVAGVPAPETYGMVSEGSYNWKVPTDLFGKTKIKLEWVRDDSSTAVPWFTQMSPEIKIISRRILPFTTK
jgi:hypothetical protein